MAPLGLRFPVLVVLAFFTISVNAAVVTKTSTFSTVSVDGTYTLLNTVSFVSGVDFPASHLIASVTTSVTFRKTSGSCNNPDNGYTYNNEIYFALVSPATTILLANTNTWGGGAQGGWVTVNFNQAAATTPSGTPTSGTFQPNGGNLNTYVGASPFGTWRIGAGDAVGQDPLCVTGYTITITTYDPLPIELLYFNAELKPENRKVDLTWSTATENNNDYFTIEKSDQGLTWDYLTTVSGAGNSTQKLDYFTEDLSPFQGISYYRLTQTDFNGMSEIFNVVSINNNSDEVKIFKDGQRILISGDFTDLQLINLAGQTISISQVTENGVVYEGFVPGIYFIHYLSNGKPFQEKIIL